MEPTVYNGLHESNQGTPTLYYPRSSGRGILTFVLFCCFSIHVPWPDNAVLPTEHCHHSSLSTSMLPPHLQGPLCDTALLRYPGQSPHVTITIWSNLNSLWPSLVTLVITFLTTGCYLINNFLLWCLDMKTFPHTGCVHIAESEKKIWINIF